jgi:hypothetical protein
MESSRLAIREDETVGSAELSSPGKRSQCDEDQPGAERRGESGDGRQLRAICQ